jgi:hypothetical protein
LSSLAFNKRSTGCLQTISEDDVSAAGIEKKEDIETG